MSDRASSSSSGACRMPNASQSGLVRRSCPSSVQPNPCMISAKVLPICPVPMTPTVRPWTSKPSSPSDAVVCAMGRPIERQHQGYGVLRHGVRGIGRHADDGQSAFGCGRQIDVVEAGAAEGDSLLASAGQCRQHVAAEAVLHESAHGPEARP